MRAPPAKWAIKGFFPAGERSEPRSRTAPKGLPQTEARDAQRGGPPLESPCRQLSLVLSFASKESTSPPRCGSPTVRAGVGASGPRQELLSAKLPYNAACRGLFARPLHSFGSPAKANLQPHGTVPALPRRSRRVRPRIRKLPTAKITYNTAREFSFSPHHRSK